jgi:hypothetical protein
MFCISLGFKGLDICRSIAGITLSYKRHIRWRYL